MASIGGGTIFDVVTNAFQSSSILDCLFDCSSSCSDNFPSYSEAATVSQLEEFPSFKHEPFDDFFTHLEINKMFVGWTEKLPQDWTANDVLDWLCTVDCYSQDGASNVKLENFKDVDGLQLCKMTKHDFTERDPINGSRIFATLTDLINKYQVFTFTELNGAENCEDQMSADGENLPIALPNISIFTSPWSNDVEFYRYDHPHSTPPPTPTELHSTASSKRSLPGSDDPVRLTGGQKKNSTDKRQFVKRPKKTKATHLWKFMRSLLDDPAYNPSYIRWENKDKGVFRIVPGQSKNIAKLWGMKKNNPTMTFDKLSRSLRWCREYGFLSKVPSNEGFPKKLCFRFGDRAMDWNGN